MAGRPMSSGSSAGLMAVPIAMREYEAGPALASRAKTVACGVSTPSQAPDHIMGIFRMSASLR